MAPKSTCTGSYTFPVGAGNYNDDGLVVAGVWQVKATYDGGSSSYTKPSTGQTTFTIA